MFGNRPWLVIVILAFVLPAFAGPAADEKALKETLEQKVRVKLLAIEIDQLTAHFEGLVKRELGLQEAIRACTKSGDNRLPEYQEALKLAPNLPDAHFRLGQAYVHQGEKDLGEKEFQIHRQLYEQHLAEVDKQRSEILLFVYSMKGEPARP